MKSKILIFSLIILVLFSVSAVSAVDADDTSIASDDSQIELDSTDDLEIAEAGGDDFSADDILAEDNDLTKTMIVAIENETYSTPLVNDGFGYYPIVLAAEDESPISNKTISVDFNGISENFETDSLGLVNYYIPNATVAGNYTINIAFAGDSEYAATSFTTNIEVYDIETRIISLGNETYPRPVISHGDGYYPIMLATDTIIPLSLANKTVTIDFNGNSATYKTSALGVIDYIFPEDTAAGNYTISIVYAGDDGYIESALEADIEVIAIETQIVSLGNETYPRPVVSQGDGYYPIMLMSDATIPFPLANETVTIDFNGNFATYQTNALGIVNFVLPEDTAAGNYTISIVYAGDDDFVGCSLEADIEVIIIETQIVSLGNETYPRPVVSQGDGYYPIMLMSDATIPFPLANKTVTVDFDGNFATYQTNAFGIVNFILPEDTVAGNYSIAVAYLGDDNFGGSALNAIIEVVDVETQIYAFGNASIPYAAVVAGNVHYPFMLTSDALIDLPLANRTVTVDFGGIVGEFTTNMLGIVDYIVPSELAPGNHTVVISYAGDDGFIGCDFTTNVELYEVETKIIALESISYSHILVDAGLAYYPIELTTNTTIPFPLAGKKISIDFNGFSYEYTTSAIGLVNFVVPDTPEGVYAIEITFAGDEAYPACEFTGYIEIVDEGTRIIAPKEATFEYGEVADGDADFTFVLATDDLIPLPVIGESVCITIVNDSYGCIGLYKTNLLGMIKYTLPDYLDAGDYVLYMEYFGDHGYEPSSASANITITKDESTLTVGDITFDCGSSGTTTVTYTGATGVTAGVVGQAGAVVKVSGNKITVSNLNVGTYTLTVTTIPDANHNAVTKTSSIVVNKGSAQIVASAVTTTYHANKNLVITLKDANGNGISGATLTVNLNGEKTYTTDSNGQVKISTKNLAPKTYTAKISFSGDSNYKSASKNVKVTVKKATPKVVAKSKKFKVATKTKKYAITLKEKTGAAIKKATVYLRVGKVTYKATTNTKGKATFKITKLNSKARYTGKITFKGNSYYNKATKKVKITVV